MTSLKLRISSFMNRSYFPLFGFAMLGLPLAVWGAQDTWINGSTASINYPVAIDATNVINYGSIGPWFNFSGTLQPFDTSNTRNLTNSGTFDGSIGFRFDNAPRNSSGQLIGLRTPLANFHNRNSGAVHARDGGTVGGYIGSLLSIEATNLINEGIITVGAGGLGKLTGVDVDLSWGAFGVVSVDADPILLGSFNEVPSTNMFMPDTAITDIYWGQDLDDLTINVANILTPNGVRTPSHRVQAPPPVADRYTQFSLSSFYFDGISNVTRWASITVTNIDGDSETIQVPTNVVKQGVFLSVPPGIEDVDISFVPSSQPTNDYSSVCITVQFPYTNVLTEEVGGTTIYFQDTLAGENDLGSLINYTTTLAGAGTPQTQRPAGYLLSRRTQGMGAPGNAELTPDFFYNQDYETNLVSGSYAAYSGEIDNIIIRPPNIPAGTATNLTGRAEIHAANLNLSRARLRGEGLLSIQATHLVDSAKAAVDTENLSLDLGSTNGLLRIKDLTKTETHRVRGPILAWSGVWSNSFSMLVTNYNVTTNGAEVELITNTVNVLFHTLIYDMSRLTTTVPVAVQQFSGTATNIVMDDQANVTLTYKLDGQSFTLNGGMNLTGAVSDWRTTNAPSLRYFTNNGSLVMPGEAHFGDDAPQSYLTLVNNGLVQSAGQNIASSYVELGGTNTSLSSFVVQAIDARVGNGRINAGNDIEFAANTLKLNQAILQTPTRLVLNVTNALQDNGINSSNLFVLGDGMFVVQKPASGDLLGTTIQSKANNFSRVTHSWPGEDRGDTVAGFTNNLALGVLTLMPNGPVTAFEFVGTGGQKALYVDLLDLSQVADWEEQLIIKPGITIYYAALKLSFTPPVGFTPEEYLDNKFGGRLRWVPQFAGPNSSVDVLINGNQTIRVNQARRYSQILDDDGDGIPNYFDFDPFGGVQIVGIETVVAPSGVRIAWQAAAGTTYHVEYRTSLTSPWQQLLTTTFDSPVNGVCSVVDTNAVGGNVMRFYRVLYNPTSQE